jgi:hypothetical protein
MEILHPLADGRWHLEGTDTTGTIIALNRDALVLKVPGGHYFGGQGQVRPYAPMRYQVYRLLRRARGHDLVVEPLLTFHPNGPLLDVAAVLTRLGLPEAPDA